MFEQGEKILEKRKKTVALEGPSPKRKSQVYTIDLGSLKKYTKILFTTDEAAYNQWVNNKKYDVLMTDEMVGGINAYLAGIL